MFYQNRFTERARQALTFAQEAAASFGHSYIGSEHLLLGLLREGGGPAAKAQFRCHGPQPGQQTRLNDNVILAGGRDMDGGQRPSTSSFRFRPSSSRRTRPGRSLCTMAS